MKYDIVLSIDIGLNGGLAFFDVATNEIGMVKNMPTKKVANKAGKEKNTIDLYKLFFLMEIPSVHKETCLVVFEDVHAFPGQGVVSVGTLLEQKGMIRGIAKALGYGELAISPKEWQKHFGIVPPKDLKGDTVSKTKALRKKWLKASSLETAKREFPEWKDKIGNQDGLSDSILLGAYAMNLLEWM